MSNDRRLGRVLALLVVSAMSATSQSADAKLGSADWEVRAAAARELFLASSRSPKDDEALISLLAREDATVRAAFVEGTGAARKYGEGYAEYVGTLSDVVMGIAGKHPEYSNVWPALVDAPYDPDSQFVAWLARHAGKVTPLLLAQVAGIDPSPGNDFAGQAIQVLGRIAGLDHDGPGPQLTAAQRLEIYGIVKSSLSSPKIAIRIGAVKGLAAMGSRDDVEIIERLTHDADMGGVAATALADLGKRLNARASGQ